MSRKFEHKTAPENPGKIVRNYNKYVCIGKDKEDPFTLGRNRGAKALPMGETERTLRLTIRHKE